MQARLQDEKKAKEVENLLRINEELKQSLEVQRSKVRASKETIKRLLIEQSRMERKQVQQKKIFQSTNKYLGQRTRHGSHAAHWPVSAHPVGRALQGPVDGRLGHGGDWQKVAEDKH